MDYSKEQCVKIADVKRDPQRKEKIIGVAMEIFSGRPYHQVTMDEIARRAGVAKSTLYYYFPSKEALYATLLHEGLNLLLRELKDQFRDESPLENLKQFIKKMVLFFLEHREALVVLQSEESALYNKRLEECYKQYCSIKEVLTNIIQEGIEKGELRGDISPRMAAHILIGMIKEPVLHGEFPPLEQAEKIFDVFTGGLGHAK